MVMMMMMVMVMVMVSNLHPDTLKMTTEKMTYQRQRLRASITSVVSTSDLVIDSNGNSDDNGDDDGVKSIDHFCGVPLPTCVHRKGDKNDSGENLPCTIRPGNGRNEASS